MWFFFSLSQTRTVSGWPSPTVLNLAIRFSTSRRAQCAILDPNTESNFFPEARPEKLEQMDLSPSLKLACLENNGKGVEDLSFVDPPGVGNMDI